jgi:hypothetical protein
MLIIGGALLILLILPFILVPGITAVQNSEKSNNSQEKIFEKTAETRTLPVFEDTFDEGLGKWQRYGYPFPEVRSDMGNPPPSFDSRGDDLYDSYALSSERFNYTDGLILEFDMYVNDTTGEGCWVDGFFCLPRTATGADAVVEVMYRPIGPACWGNPPEQIGHGVYDWFITNESGRYEYKEIIGGPADEDLEEWHTHRIVIHPDGYVDFYRDRELMYRPVNKVSMEYSDVPLKIGARSYPDYGPALIDNVRVYSYDQLEYI